MRHAKRRHEYQEHQRQLWGLECRGALRLILAASGRNDEAERDRLAQAASQITIAMTDHGPFANAFSDIANLMFIELLADSADYLDLCQRTCEMMELGDEEDETARTAKQVGEESTEHSESGSHGESEEITESECSAWYQNLALSYAVGYLLRTKIAGWELFCGRLDVPPFLLWEMAPGYERFQHVRAVTEKTAFVAEGFLQWLNSRRPKGKPELLQAPLTVEMVADENDKAFRQRILWWGV